MERAVRALEREGVPRRHIEVRRAQSDGDWVEPAPELGASLRRGSALGALGGVIWIIAGMVTLPPDQMGLSLAFRVVSAVIVGALIGATIGAVVGAVRKRADATYPDYLVEVETESKQRRRDIRERLEDLEGDPLSA